MSWGLVGSVFGQGSTLAVNLLIANLLGREVFGRYSVVQNTAVITLQVAQLATGYTATKYLAEYRVADPQRAGRILSICGLIAVCMSVLTAFILAGSSTLLAERVLKVPTLAPALDWSAAIVLFGVNAGFLTGALIGLEEYRLLGLCNVVAGVVYALCCLIGTLERGFTGALAGLTIAYLAQTLLLAWALRRALARHGLAVSLHALGRELDVVIRFTLPAAIAGLSGMPAVWLATAALVRTPDGINRIAIYTAAFNLRIAAVFLPNVVNNVGLAILNNERGHGSERSYRKAFWTNWFSVVGFSILMAGLLALGTPYALRLFGRAFVSGSLVAQLLLASAVIESIALATNQVLQNRERLWLNLATYTLPRDLTMVSMAFVLAARHGAVGLAVAVLAAQTVSALLVILAVVRIGIHAPRADLPAQ